MSARFVVTGTDTDIGKTVFAAALVGALDAYYWKPVQAGLEEETDSEAVLRLSGVDKNRILPENFRLKIPASPHYSAAQEGITITADDLGTPDAGGSDCGTPLIIEGAGGALVPVNRNLLYADLFAIWNLPTIVVASTRLGTINHSLMTIEALRSRNIPIHGIAFIGDEIIDSQDTICRLGAVRPLGRLPMIDNLDAKNLAAAFAAHFNRADFTL